MAGVSRKKATMTQKEKAQMVFGLDIGTRSIVGTVGYRDGERFIVKAECARSMKPVLCWTDKSMISVRSAVPLKK